MNDTIIPKLQASRPNAKLNTLVSYVNYFNKLYKLYTDTKNLPPNINWLHDHNKIEALVKAKYQPTTQKNIYNALVIIVMAYDPASPLVKLYGRLRDKAHEHYETMVLNHTKSDKQKANWVELKDIDKLLEQLRKEANLIYRRIGDRKKVDKRDFFKLQDYVVLLTYRHIPMRNDIAYMKVLTKSQLGQLVQSEQDTHNFLVGNERDGYEFHINEYKTRKTFGRKIIKSPPELNRELKRWLKINHTRYFIVNSLMRPITANSLSKLLTRITKAHLGKNVGSQMLRHIYLTDKYAKVLEEKQNDSHNMGHSLQQQQDYIKT